MMTTERCNCISYYLLHFHDMENDTDVFETVTSGNLSTLRYYANKMRTTRNLFLAEFYELCVVGHCIWLTKYQVVTKEREFKFKRYYVPVYDNRQTFDQFLRTRNQTQTMLPQQQTTT